MIQETHKRNLPLQGLMNHIYNHLSIMGSGLFKQLNQMPWLLPFMILHTIFKATRTTPASQWYHHSQVLGWKQISLSPPPTFLRNLVMPSILTTIDQRKMQGTMCMSLNTWTYEYQAFPSPCSTCFAGHSIESWNSSMFLNFSLSWTCFSSL